MKYKYSFVWGNRTAFIYANDMITAKADFEKVYGFDPDDKKNKVFITRSNS